MWTKPYDIEMNVLWRDFYKILFYILGYLEKKNLGSEYLLQDQEFPGDQGGPKDLSHPKKNASVSSVINRGEGP